RAGALRPRSVAHLHALGHLSRLSVSWIPGYARARTVRRATAGGGPVATRHGDSLLDVRAVRRVGIGGLALVAGRGRANAPRRLVRNRALPLFRRRKNLAPPTRARTSPGQGGVMNLVLWILQV